MNSGSEHVFERYNSQLGIGDIERHSIEYDNSNGEESVVLWLKIKNKTSISHLTSYLAGPFMLYFDVRLQNYHHSQAFDLSDDHKPIFETALLPQKNGIIKLVIPPKQKRSWYVDTISEILFNKTAKVIYEVSLASTKKLLKGKVLKKCTLSKDSNLHISHQNTSQLWGQPLSILDTPVSSKPIHLVVLTHGIHSNVSTDMLYLKEQIMQSYVDNPDFDKEQIVVKGYTGNVCETERGVKYLGVKLAKYIINELYNEQIVKISFIGHSLGGLIQTFAIAYISILHPSFFKKVEPMNFITLASPLLGLHSHSPTYVKYALGNGMIGKVGLDLNLEKDITNEKIPLLYLLSGDPTKTILRKFKRRTAYANSMNDGIVPLYTSSLLYIDYNDVLQNIAEFKKKNHVSKSLPKTSVLSSITSVVLLPRPSEKYILDPSTRDDPIIHDKLYTPEDISQIQNTYKDTTLYKYLKSDSKANYNFVKLMADNWHNYMTWRKVIVAMKPDAHNNIIVRRRFGNAYGWSIVDHLVTEHFMKKVEPEVTVSTKIDSLTVSVEATNIQSIDPNKLYSWLTRVEGDYQDGMLTNVSGILQKSFRY